MTCLYVANRGPCLSIKKSLDSPPAQSPASGEVKGGLQKRTWHPHAVLSLSHQASVNTCHPVGSKCPHGMYLDAFFIFTLNEPQVKNHSTNVSQS